MDKVKEIIKNADAAIILTGSGMGVDSGLATFRDPNNGFWTHYPALKGKELNFYKIANPQAFETHPELALAFYGHRHRVYSETTPHDGYRKLYEWSKTLKLGAFFVTTNVDGHHYKDIDDEVENFPIFEEHGNINSWICSRYACESRTDGPLTKPEFEVDEENFVASYDSKVNCKECGSILRPNILMFDDADFEYSQFAAQRAKYDQFVSRLLERKKFPNVVVIMIGAGNVITTMQSKMFDLSGYGFASVNINHEESIAPVDHWIKGGALETLEELFYEF